MQQHFYPLLSETLCFSSHLLKDSLLPNTQSLLICQLTHAWPSTTNNIRAPVLNQLKRAKIATGRYSNVTLSSIVMYKVTDLKAGPLKRCSSGRGELLLLQTLTFLSFKILYMHKIYRTLREKEKTKKHSNSPLSLSFHSIMNAANLFISRIH